MRRLKVFVPLTALLLGSAAPSMADQEPYCTFPEVDPVQRSWHEINLNDLSIPDLLPDVDHDINLFVEQELWDLWWLRRNRGCLPSRAVHPGHMARSSGQRHPHGLELLRCRAADGKAKVRLMPNGIGYRLSAIGCGRRDGALVDARRETGVVAVSDMARVTAIERDS
ncbi:hypothetical protein JXA88_16835, partial [Candidatus Fermentibacteria bacterium]|nr:hypothetical protein [Candidatus Fermentibacteria bacterium]